MHIYICIFMQLTLFCTTLLVCAGIRSMYIFICKICWILWGPFFKKYIMLLICAQKPNLPKLCHQRALNYLHSKQFLCFIFRKTRKYPLQGYFIGVLTNTTAWCKPKAWFEIVYYLSLLHLAQYASGSSNVMKHWGVTNGSRQQIERQAWKIK